MTPGRNSPWFPFLHCQGANRQQNNTVWHPRIDTRTISGSQVTLSNQILDYVLQRLTKKRMGITYRSLWEASGTVASYSMHVCFLSKQYACRKCSFVYSKRGGRDITAWQTRACWHWLTFFLFLLCLFLHGTVHICYKWPYRHMEVGGRRGGKHKTRTHIHTDKCLRLHKYTEF